ncbi:MAG: c-type cytochrome [Candidatus Aminicenantes bacterium]|nr:c-type cytochrome [Candidatus Aminicenantes bacterium]
MKHKMICLIIFLGFLFVTGFPDANTDTGTVPDANSQLEKVKAIFKKSCTGCHGGLKPDQELNLEPATMMSDTVNVSSMEKTDLKLINTADPSMSYLLMKIKGDPNIVGKRMPKRKKPLADEAIKTIEEWIMSLKET